MSAAPYYVVGADNTSKANLTTTDAQRYKGIIIIISVKKVMFVPLLVCLLAG